MGYIQIARVDLGNVGLASVDENETAFFLLLRGIFEELIG